MRVSKNGKTVTFEVSVWWEPKDKKFRIKSNDPVKFILTVSDKPSQKRGHPKLFRELEKVLKSAEATQPTPQEIKGQQ
jgi:hypothetical protein